MTFHVQDRCQGRACLETDVPIVWNSQGGKSSARFRRWAPRWHGGSHTPALLRGWNCGSSNGRGSSCLFSSCNNLSFCPTNLSCSVPASQDHLRETSEHHVGSYIKTIHCINFSENAENTSEIPMQPLRQGLQA